MPARKTPIEKVCCLCGATFYVQPYRALTAQCCSWRCAQTVKSSSTVARRAELLRDRGENRAYRKWFGRHKHRVIAETMIGRPLLPSEVVHHIDGNMLNNETGNLMVLTQSEHIKLHRQMMMKRRAEVAGY